MAQKIQFLRNATISENRAAALSALEAKLKTSTNDGEPIINMYYDGEGESKTIKTLFGIVTNNGGYSIFTPSDASSSDVDEKILAAINALDKSDVAVTNQYVSQVVEENGLISVSRVALPVTSVSSSDKTVTVTNTDGAIDVKVSEYIGSDTIKVSDVDLNNQKTISLIIDSTDKVLTQGENGLLANISMSYVSTDKKIYLYGKDSTTAISTIDASDFVKDGMLSSVKYSTGDDAHTTAEGPYLVFTWNTDSGVTTPMWVSLKGLVDIYTGTTNEIVVEDNVISLAEAIKNAIAAALTEISVSTSEVDSKGYVSAKVSTKADKKQEIGVGVTYGSFKTDTEAQVSGIATVEAVNDVIVANEKATSAALNELNSDIEAVSGKVTTLESTVLKTVEASDKSVTVSATKDNKASIKVNVDGNSIVLDTTNGYISVWSIDCGEY